MTLLAVNVLSHAFVWSYRLGGKRTAARFVRAVAPMLDRLMPRH